MEYLDQSELNANGAPKRPFQLMIFPGHSQTMQQCLVADLCINTLATPDLILAHVTSHHILLLHNLEAGRWASQTGAAPGALTSMTFAPCDGQTHCRCVYNDLGLHAWMQLAPSQSIGYSALSTAMRRQAAIKSVS